jgi:GNAT superfamily N-acetyltransferase
MISLRALKGPELEAALDAVASLRISVFRDWPYLYDGTLDYERAYLDTYRDNPGALLVAAFDGETLVGASTSTFMEDHAAEFAAPFRALNIPLTSILYGAESLILPAYRGRGLGTQFIQHREAHARAHNRSHVAFCSVRRPEDHPLKPAGARSNDAFWRRNGYEPLPGILAEFSWKDVGDAAETPKQLQFWMRQL